MPFDVDDAISLSGRQMADRLRLILIGLITALVCGMMLYASFFHLSI